MFRILSLTLCLSIGTIAHAELEPDPDTCVVRPTLSCPVALEKVHFTESCPDDPPTPDGFRFYCAKTAPRAEIVCEGVYNVVVCEAWPQSPEVQYRYFYTVLGGIGPDYSVIESSPMLYGNCSGRTGRVSVTVMAPDGTSSAAQTLFPCLNNQ